MATAFVVRWQTDRGLLDTRGVYQESDPLAAIRDQAQAVEAQGVTVLGVFRVTQQEVPLVDGAPCWPIAGSVVRVPEGQFHVQQEAESIFYCSPPLVGA